MSTAKINPRETTEALPSAKINPSKKIWFWHQRKSIHVKINLATINLVKVKTNTVTTIVPWRVQSQKLSGHLEVQKLSKRVSQNNRKRPTFKFG